MTTKLITKKLNRFFIKNHIFSLKFYFKNTFLIEVFFFGFQNVFLLSYYFQNICLAYQSWRRLCNSFFFHFLGNLIHHYLLHSLHIISKFMIFACLKWASVSLKKSTHFIWSYQVSRPSRSYHSKSLGTYFGIYVFIKLIIFFFLNFPANDAVELPLAC